MRKERELSEDNIVRIASKEEGAYLGAITHKLENYDEVILTAFGRNLDKAFSLAERSKELFNVNVLKIKSFSQKDENGVEHKGVMVRLKKKSND